jgi:hypothetical protein
MSDAWRTSGARVAATRGRRVAAPLRGATRATRLGLAEGEVRASRHASGRAPHPCRGEFEGTLTAIAFARAWARALIRMHGVGVQASRVLAGRRYGVHPDAVFLREELADAWIVGSYQRATSRPGQGR